MLKYVVVSLVVFLFSCSKNTFEEYNGVNLKTPVTTKKIETQKSVISKPGRVHKTYHKNHRIIPVFRIDIDERGNEEYSGSSYFHTSWHSDDSINAWHNHFMPGLSAI